ncbi:MAG: transporter substrate-binding protein [Betaproteobacteria bacterium]|nr:transporter substrate-binding protein [Betaproteobacteria bacterium]
MTICVCLAASGPVAGGELRVCADPQNLPYSREDGAGFENRVMQVVARELGARVKPVWLPEGRGYVRKTLNAGLCDVLAGVPAELDLVLTTAAYYQSSYVFVSRADRGEPYRSFDDARLLKAKIGVQLIGDESAATPPVHALAARGLTNVTGYTIHGERPQVERMIDDVASGAVDVAVAWGPQAGFFASRQDVPLQVAAAQAPPDLAQIPFEFSISMGVRKTDAVLQHALDAALVRARPDIDRILADYAVPRVDVMREPRAEAAR